MRRTSRRPAREQTVRRGITFGVVPGVAVDRLQAASAVDGVDAIGALSPDFTDTGEWLVAGADHLPT